MPELPDVISEHARVLFCGAPVTACAQQRGHHYAARGDAFWRLLAVSGLTPRELAPAESHLLPQSGLGVTTLRWTIGAGGARQLDLTALAGAVAEAGPQWLAFTGKAPAALVARAVHQTSPSLGPQDWEFRGRDVFVLPSSSSANQRGDYDGRPDRALWWSDLAALVGAEHPAGRTD